MNPKTMRWLVERLGTAKCTGCGISWVAQSRGDLCPMCGDSSVVINLTDPEREFYPPNGEAPF